MNVTPSQREFYAGHLARLKTFWPPPKAAPDMAPSKFFSLAWNLLDEPPSIHVIQEITAEHFRVPLMFMKAQGRRRESYLPRAAAIYLCRQFTPKSLSVIGRHFGGRDHTTVMHSARAIEKMIELKHPISKDIEALKIKIGGDRD